MATGPTLPLDTSTAHHEGDNMHELTIHELDTELAEQLPARELMGTAVAITQGQAAIYAYKSLVAGSGNILGVAVAVNLPISIKVL
jgi:hypothetical protein